MKCQTPGASDLFLCWISRMRKMMRSRLPADPDSSRSGGIAVPIALYQNRKPGGLQCHGRHKPNSLLASNKGIECLLHGFSCTSGMPHGNRKFTYTSSGIRVTPRSLRTLHHEATWIAVGEIKGQGSGFQAPRPMLAIFPASSDT